MRARFTRSASVLRATLAEVIRHAPRLIPVERSGRLLDSFWRSLEVEATKVVPRSPVGEAIAYARSNRDALSRYLEAPCLAIDNNAVENALRPVASGRRNRLHLRSDARGRTAAVLMSLVQSCRRLGNEPFAYQRDALGRVGTRPAGRVEDLLPDRRVLPGPPDGSTTSTSGRLTRCR